MQPRRELDQGPYEQAGEQPGGSYDQAENYQPVKPVGYEARLAFQRENQGRQPVQRVLFETEAVTLLKWN